MTSETEKLFETAMRGIYDQAVADLNYRPTYFLRMINEMGAFKAAKALLASPKISDGFVKLLEYGRTDLSLEALVLRPEFINEFDASEVQRARERLPVGMQSTITSGLTNAVTALTGKLKIWRSALLDEQNAILNSIYLLTDSLIAQTIFSDRDIFPKLPDFLARQIHNGFGYQHFVLVRSLVDDPPSGLFGPRGVNSVPTLLSDLTKHHTLLTRRALFAVQSPSLEYSEDIARKKEMDWLQRQPTGRMAIVPQSLVSDYTIEKHHLIDVLAERPTIGPRGDDDSISAGLLNRAMTRVMIAADEVASLANKFVAHAATDQSVARANLAIGSLDLNTFMECDKVLCGATDLLCRIVTGQSRGFVMNYLCNQFAGLEIWIGEEGIKKCQTRWEEMRMTVSSWTFHQFLNAVPPSWEAVNRG